MSTPHTLAVQTPAPRRSWRPLSVLLLDVSASMEAGRPRRIDLLWDAVTRLHTPHSRWRVAVFSSRCWWVDLQACPEPQGSTDLAGAFAEVGQVAPTAVTLVTDGDPDDREAAYAAGLALRCPVHILYVGGATDGDTQAWCERLCRATGGTCATEVLDLASLAAITQTMRKMLGDGTPAATAIPLGGVS